MSPKGKHLGEFEQMIIAAVLRLGEDAYGIPIIETIESLAGREVRSGALSVTLDRMEQKGLVRSRLADPSDGRGGRPRRYVEVTEAGRAAAAESRDAMLALWTGLDEAFGR